MARGKETHWKPKAIFLLPNTYQNGDSWPNKERQAALESDGYGKCVVKVGLDRSLTKEQLVNEVTKQFPRREADLAKTGVDFAKITQGSKKITVHVLVKGHTVADLEKLHGQGILVILQKAHIASERVPKPRPKQSGSTPLIKVENKSPNKLQSKLQIKSEPKSYHGPHDEVQVELDRLVQLGGIKIAHLNCQSLCNKMDELRLLLLCRTDIDVMTLSETWLKPTDSNDSFNVPGYTIMARRDGVRNAEDRPRGGVLTYVRDSLAISAGKCPIPLARGLEAVCIDIELGIRASKQHRKVDVHATGKRLADKSKSDACMKRAFLRILNVYVPPGTRDQIAQFKKLQDSMDTLRAADVGCKPTTSGGIGIQKRSCSCKTNYVILGDLNCDRKTLADCKVMKSVKGEKLLTLDELESSHHLSQMIEDYTRVGSRRESGQIMKTESVIDLVYVDDQNSILESGVVHIAMSDHYMVYCSWMQEKGLGKTAPFQTQDVAFRRFSSLVKSDIDQVVFDLIRARDSAKASEDWDRYESLKDEITAAKNINKKERKQYEKELKLKTRLKQVKVAL